MASEFNKPNGIAIVRTRPDLQTLVWPLASAARSTAWAPSDENCSRTVYTPLASLAARPRDWLVAHFAAHWRLAARCRLGSRRSPRGAGASQISMSRETTFDRDLHAVTGRCWARSSPSCASRWRPTLQRKGYAGRTIGIKLRYDDFPCCHARPLPSVPADAGRHRHPPRGPVVPQTRALDKRLRLLGCA